MASGDDRPDLPAGFRPIRVLGEGGMAAVVLAEDRRADPPRSVAVKVLRGDLPAALVEGFREEFRILASLRHPGLARVFEFGTAPAGRPYYTAEFVDGNTLAQDPAPGHHDACLALAAVCRTLSYLHARGYIHNDVKPSNIVLPGGAPAAAKLLDFGLAGIERQAGRTVAGTPGYIAPERLAGRAWDGRADLYSVGATLYRLLGGRPVTQADRPTDALGELRRGRPPLEALRPDLPDKVTALCADLLALDPGQRPRHATEVVARIGEALGEPIPLETPGSAHCYALASLLVGREAEIAECEHLLARAGAGAGPLGLAVTGPPGVGKSRLVHETAWRAGIAGWHTAATRAGAEADPTAPLRDLARQVGAGGADPSDVGRFVEALVAAAPPRLLIVIDDAHRAADLVWQACFEAARRAALAHKAVVVALALDAEDLSSAVRQRLALANASGELSRLALGPLGESARRRLLDSLFGPGVLDEEIERDVARRSGGNPLLVEEAVRELVETGALEATRTGWKLGSKPADGQARAHGSARLEDFLRRRCRNLEGDARATLAAMAALGGRADAGALSAVAGAAVDAMLGLALLADRGLIVGETTGVRLTHEALADIALAEVADPERRALGERAVAWMEAHGADPGALCVALRRAGRLEGAFDRACEAGALGLAVGEGRLAAHWMDQALEIAGTASVPVGRLAPALRAAAEAYHLVGRVADALAALERAWAIGAEQPTRERARTVALGIRTGLVLLDDDAADRWIERGATIDVASDPLSRVLLVRALAIAADLRGRFRIAREHLQSIHGSLDALAEDREGLLLRTNVLSSFSIIEVNFDLRSAADLARRALEAAERTGNRELFANTASNVSHCLLSMGDPDGAAAVLHAVVSESERSGNANALAYGLSNLAEADHQRGEWESARARLARARSLLPGRPNSLLDFDAEAAVRAWREADFEAAEREARRLLDAPTHTLAAKTLPLIAAAAAAERGDATAAAKLADRAEADAARAEAPLDRILARLVRGFALAAADPRRGADLLREACVALDGFGYRANLPAILRDTARWLVRAGQAQSARACLARARELLAKTGCAPANAQIDALESQLLPGSPRTEPKVSASLARLFKVRTLDDLGRAVAATAREIGVGEPRLYADSDGAPRPIGGPPTPDDARRAPIALRALRSGVPQDDGGTRLVPVREGGLGVCIAVEASDTAAGALLLEAVIAAIARLADLRDRAAGVAGDGRSLAGPTAPICAVEISRRLGPAESRRLELTVGPVELRHDFPGVVGRGPAMERALGLLDRMAESDAPVLLLGETGTGKEVFARALHDASARRDGPFVAVNCSAIPAALFEAEVFGFRRGAFTGAVRDHLGLAQQASGGVLFLDEVGELAPDLQPKLLRVLEERKVRPVGATSDLPVDLRLVCASNRDLAVEVAAGRFRADLYFRLNVVEIRLPPLRERAGDLPELCQHVLARLGRAAETIAPSAMRALVGYPWPGNVRELENELQRASALAGGEPIHARHLSPRLRSTGERSTSSGRGTLAQQQHSWEREAVRNALAAAGGHRGRAARALGITREGLRLKMRRLGLRAPAPSGGGAGR